MIDHVQDLIRTYSPFIFREAATWKGKPTKGRRTFVVFIRDGFAHFGVSQCCNKDQFLRRRGLEIAIGRAVSAANSPIDSLAEKDSYSISLENIGLCSDDKRSVLARGILNQLNYLGFRQKAHI